MKGGESTTYKDVFRYRVAMPWRADEFAQAFDRLVARHPALRSSFELSRHSVPVQVVRACVPRAFDIVTGADDAGVREYMSALHRQSYDFCGGPLYSLRAFVFGSSVDLVFAFHHAILDGFSVANLVGELLQDYLFRLGIEETALKPNVLLDNDALRVRPSQREAVASVPAQQFWRQALAGSRLPHWISMASTSHQLPRIPK